MNATPATTNSGPQVQAAYLAEVRSILRQVPVIYGEMRVWRSSHPAPVSTLKGVADHIDHVRNIAGIDHVGIGSDFEGFFGQVEGLGDVSCCPSLVAELMNRCYRRHDIAKVAGLNLLWAFREVERIGAEMEAEIVPK